MYYCIEHLSLNLESKVIILKIGILMRNLPRSIPVIVNFEKISHANLVFSIFVATLTLPKPGSFGVPRAGGEV